MSVIERAEQRLAEEECQHEMGADKKYTRKGKEVLTDEPPKEDA